eukprot:3040706-Alexandrium_andersonii.AAC.1
MCIRDSALLLPEDERRKSGAHLEADGSPLADFVDLGHDPWDVVECRDDRVIAACAWRAVAGDQLPGLTTLNRY